MADDFPCGVCGRRVYLDDTHVVVEVETKRPDDSDTVDDYVIHWECRDSVFGGWSTP